MESITILGPCSNVYRHEYPTLDDLISVGRMDWTRPSRTEILCAGFDPHEPAPGELCRLVYRTTTEKGTFTWECDALPISVSGSHGEYLFEFEPHWQQLSLIENQVTVVSV